LFKTVTITQKSDESGWLAQPPVMAFFTVSRQLILCRQIFSLQTDLARNQQDLKCLKIGAGAALDNRDGCWQRRLGGAMSSAVSVGRNSRFARFSS
jgi:hypothetical protein